MKAIHVEIPQEDVELVSPITHKIVIRFHNRGKLDVAFLKLQLVAVDYAHI